RDSLAARAAARMPLPSALPARDAALRERGSRAAGNRSWTTFRLSPERCPWITSLLVMDKLAAYYAQRAAEYERFYSKPERQADHAILRDRIPELLSGRRVL